MKAGTEVRDEVWSYVWDASMFQYACPTMTLSYERQPVCQPRPVYPTVLCAILSVKQRSCEELAVELREALNERIDGIFRETSPLVSVALLPLFPLSTPKKLLAFEHGRDRYKLRRAALDWHSRDIYLYEFSLWTPPSAPYASSWGEFSNVHLANTWLRQNHRSKSFPKSRAAYGQCCNPKGWNST